MRNLSEIATDIEADWHPVYFSAVPYLSAMHTLENVNDSFYEDSGRSIVHYFLANAQSWRGETARRIKKELKELLRG